ncbi:MAG: cytochrome b/b6 domain-containing protein [Anaerolineales bacterium]|uniref:cytochrome b n=1 Tax=Candidatus Villigracilis vicinus TaxID=3140679 RepID=UPI003135B5AB|nr:cytochrome b/b6 domain-containing protein [Anaerolineales bacterium]
MTKTSPKKYHPIQVTLHWLVVLLVVAAFVMGKSMSGLPNDANKLAPLALHMGVGIFTLVVIVTRFITRMKLPKPEHVTAGNAFFDWIGKAVHYALYLLVFLTAVSGMSLSMQAGLVPIVFGGSSYPLPADFFDFTARMLHGFIVPALLLLVLLHVGAAFYHQFMLKDNLLARMWYGK